MVTQWLLENGGVAENASTEMVQSYRPPGEDLEGSIFEWANSGHPVVRGEDSAREVPVSEVHPFDDRWGLLLSEELRSQ